MASYGRPLSSKAPDVLFGPDELEEALRALVSDRHPHPPLA